ncbi:hypothetical protein GLOIN_2v1584045, partial [Rhizophagus irregularis DAOM 181602=DAOM 197198]
ARKFEILEGSNTDITVLTVMIMYHVRYYISCAISLSLLFYFKITSFLLIYRFTFSNPIAMEMIFFII